MRWWKIIVSILFLVVLDQATKGIIRSNYYIGEITPVIDGLFNITYVRNRGAAFGFGADSIDWVRQLLFLFVPVVACVWLVFLLKGSRKTNKLLTVAYGLILAGAIGNLIDRFWLGYVVDFLDFYWKASHFPSFNVADSCITIAAALLIWDFLLVIKQKKTS